MNVFGRMVVYRTIEGADVPAIVTATVDTLIPSQVERQHVDGLASDQHVHLTVFSPGILGQSAQRVSNVAYAGETPQPRTWRYQL